VPSTIVASLFRTIQGPRYAAQWLTLRESKQTIVMVALSEKRPLQLHICLPRDRSPKEPDHSCHCQQLAKRDRSVFDAMLRPGSSFHILRLRQSTAVIVVIERPQTTCYLMCTRCFVPQSERRGFALLLLRRHDHCPQCANCDYSGCLAAACTGRSLESSPKRDCYFSHWLLSWRTLRLDFKGKQRSRKIDTHAQETYFQG
jgi:hypothetical protein